LGLFLLPLPFAFALQEAKAKEKQREKVLLLPLLCKRQKQRGQGLLLTGSIQGLQPKRKKGLKMVKTKKNKKGGTWSSLVYGTRFEHEHFNKVVGSNPAVPVKKYK
jgi:hypothetical protein